MDAQTVLIIILAVALGIFLILAIALAVMLIQVTKRVKDITDKAGNAVNNVVDVGHLIKRSLSPAVFSAVVTKAVRKFISKDTKKKGKD